jgi:hypothetical protein
MRKQFGVFLMSFAISKAAFTQYKPFTFEMGTGLAIPSSQSSGLLLYLEPGYGIGDRLKVSIRLEAAFLPMKTVASTALTFDYYFVHDQGLRLSAGAGYSYYNEMATGGCDPGPSATGVTSSTNHSGALIRTGIEFNHFRLGLEYNFVPSTYVTAMSADGKNSSTAIYSNSYFAIKIGVVFRHKKKLRNSGIQ